MSEIKLPPLPRLQVPRIDADIDLMDIRRLVKWAEDIANTHARAAIKADRQNHIEGVRGMVPSDDDLIKLVAGRKLMLGCDPEEWLECARALLARYGSARPESAA